MTSPPPTGVTASTASPLESYYTEMIEDEAFSNDGNSSKETMRRTSSLEEAQMILGKIDGLRRRVGALVNHDKVQLFIVSLIAINAIMMGIATFDFVDENDNVRKGFETLDRIFLIIFTIELGLQFIYHGLRLFLDGWLIFDFVIIIMSWSFDSVQIIRAFRIFRALRLITRVKIMKNLVLAMFEVMPRMTAIWGLLGLIFYIFGVMFTQLFSEMENGSYNYFTRLDNSFFSLFQIMTLDAWADVSREVIDEYKFAWIPILAFVIVSAFVVVNLIIAVLCEAISALEGEDRARIMGGGGDNSGQNDDGDEGGSCQEQVVTKSNAQELLAEELASLEERVANMEEMHRQTMKAMAILTQRLATNGRSHHRSTTPLFEINPTQETSGSSMEC